MPIRIVAIGRTVKTVNGHHLNAHSPNIQRPMNAIRRHRICKVKNIARIVCWIRDQRIWGHCMGRHHREFHPGPRPHWATSMAVIQAVTFMLQVLHTVHHPNTGKRQRNEFCAWQSRIELTTRSLSLSECTNSIHSRYTHRSNAHGPRSLYSVASSTKTGRSNRSRRAGARIEAMSAPNPFCPNVKGVCCLMLLLNLGLILVTLGFVIVIQFIEPLFVWWVANVSTFWFLLAKQYIPTCNLKFLFGGVLSAIGS